MLFSGVWPFPLRACMYVCGAIVCIRVRVSLQVNVGGRRRRVFVCMHVCFVDFLSWVGRGSDLFLPRVIRVSSWAVDSCALSCPVSRLAGR